MGGVEGPLARRDLTIEGCCFILFVLAFKMKKAWFGLRKGDYGENEFIEEGAGFIISLIFKDPFSFHPESYTYFPHLEISLFSLILFLFFISSSSCIYAYIVTYILYLFVDMSIHLHFS